MSRDIRSFFGAKQVKEKVPSVSSSAQKRKPIDLDDSDNEQERKSDKFEKGSSSKSKETKPKKRRIIESSDEDETKPLNGKDEPISSKLSKLSSKTPEGKKLKPVDISNVFGNGPVKRVEKEKKEKKPIKSEIDIFDADTDEMEIMDIDDEPEPESSKKSNDKKTKKEKTPRKEEKVKEEKKTPKKEEAVLKSKDNIKTPPKAKVKTEKASPKKEKQDEKKDRKRTPKDEESHSDKKNKETPTSKKKQKKQTDDDSELDRSVYDPDQEKHERRRAAAMLYKQMQNRGGPANPGSKEVPKGKPNCLAGLKFVLTGVFDSLERDEAASIIKDLGGSVTSAISGKTNYVVAGEESGPAKLAKAEDMNIPIINEDDLLDLIREKSGLPTRRKKKVDVKKVKEADSPAKKADKHSTTDNKVKKEKTSPSPKKHQSPGKKAADEKEPETNANAIVKSEPNPEKELSLAWVDKYKPKSIKDIIGQQGSNSNCAKLVKWLTNWHKNNNGKSKTQRPNPWAKNDDGAFFKAALLSGPPGVGKTTTAQLVCEHLGYDTIEFNASDTRSKKLLQVEVGELLKNKTLHGYFNGRNTSLTEKQVLVMDEVDGMAGNEDRGGMQELIGLIKSTSVPIICMCNDRNHPKIRSLVNYCFDLRFGRPQIAQIKGAIMSILFKEKVKIPPATVEEIIQATNNDVRQTLNSISLLAVKPESATASRGNDGKKDLKLGPWEVVRKVFSAEEHKNMTLNDKADLFFHDYSMGPLFVQQNYLMVAPNGPKSKAIEQVALTADSLSLGDLVESRIRSRMAWSMLPVQAMFSSVLPGEYMSGQITGQINFPGWLGKYSKTSKRNRLAQEIHDHTRVRTSGSRLSIRLDYAPFLLHNIVQPLIDDQNDGVEEALNVIKEYRLLREDIDALVELTTWPGKKSLLDQVDGRVKAALTRAYNKEVAPYTYSAVTNIKKKKASGADDDYMNEYGEGEGGEQIDDSDDERDDKVENDVMIKPKKASGSKASGSSKASTSGSSRSTGTSSKRVGNSRKK